MPSQIKLDDIPVVNFGEYMLNTMRFYGNKPALVSGTKWCPLRMIRVIENAITLSLLMSTLKAFVDSVDQDQTAQNVQSDL